MEQVYFVRPADSGDGLECVYQYGNYTYYGPVDVPKPKSAANLGTSLAAIQRVQGSIPFCDETSKLAVGEVPARCLASLKEVMTFVGEELTSVIEEIAELAATETWLDSDGASLYFEFELRGDGEVQVRPNRPGGNTLALKRPRLSSLRAPTQRCHSLLFGGETMAARADGACLVRRGPARRPRRQGTAWECRRSGSPAPRLPPA